MTAAQHAFLGVFWHVGGFTGEFLRAPHVDAGETGVHVGERVGVEGADFCVLTFWRHRVRGGGGMGDIAG